jgi:hypothetical protein
MNIRKILIPFFIILIVLSGIFRNYVSLFYSQYIEWLFDKLNWNYLALIENLTFITNDGLIEFGLGAFCYFGTYLILHFGLIYCLFFNSSKIWKSLMITLASAVIGFGLLTILLKVLELNTLGKLSYTIFGNLIGQPIVLFLVEGGGSIYQYIEKRLS